jgi:hypothetical protein
MQSAGVGNEQERSDRSGVATAILARIRAAARRGFARLGHARGGRHMELVERLELGGRRQLLLVVCDGQRYLVGAGSDSVHSIAEMRAEPELGHCVDEAMRCDA